MSEAEAILEVIEELELILEELEEWLLLDEL